MYENQTALWPFWMFLIKSLSLARFLTFAVLFKSTYSTLCGSSLSSPSSVLKAFKS